MGNEITIVTDQRGGLAPRQPDPWSQGFSMPPQAHHEHASVFTKMHKLLRGRYPLAITLGLTCGIIAGIAGYMSRKPMYEGLSMIDINPTLVGGSVQDLGRAIPDAGTFVEMLMMEMTNTDIVRAAMLKPEWTSVHPNGGPDVNTVIANLDVEKVIGTDLVKLTYDDPDPKAAQAGASAVTGAFLDWYHITDLFSFESRLSILADKRTRLTQQVSADEGAIANFQNQMGNAEDQVYRDGLAQELITLELQMQDAQTRLDDIKAALAGQTPPAQTVNNPANGTDQGNTSAPPLTPDQIAMVDPYMRQLMARRTTQEEEIKLLQRNYPPGSYAVERATDALQLINAGIDDYARQFTATQRGRMAPAPNGANNPPAPIMPGMVTQADLDRAQRSLDNLASRQKILADKVQQNNDWETKIEKTKEDLESARSQLETVVTAVSAINDMVALNQGQVTPVGGVALPSAPSDHKRDFLAVLGFMGGASLPVGVLLMVGMLDRRLRYSDETNRQMSGIPLLGILPNLPDLLSDPDQAATAAHCVHQIRTLLQINSHANDRRAFCVTSGSSGDGKTSLTLALGLSFAASGSRTLMIDADLVGGGLSTRLGIHSDKGILDAMAKGTLADCVQTTDVNGLSILPIGQAVGAFAGTISPAALRRLVADARKQYDIVLIDTGPILGSIEASPVAAASDAVILCVSRGQQRPLVDRALAHLQVIGATLAGVVFNRAQGKDFELSVSRSMPQSGNGNGANGNGARNGHSLGPVAKAVASSVRGSENDGN